MHTYTLNGSFGSDVRVILKVTLLMAQLIPDINPQM